MPIYEYRCDKCGHQQEFLLKVSDAPLTVCTKCGAPSFSKMVTAAGFQLKGSGWYATDFKNSGKPAAKSSGDSAKSDAAPKTDAAPKSDAAPKTDAAPKGDSKSDGGEKKAAPSSGAGGCPACS